MIPKVSVIVISVEAIIYLLLYNLRHCTFTTGLGKIFRNFRNSPIVLFILVVLDFNVPQKVIEHQEIHQVVYDMEFARQCCYYRNHYLRSLECVNIFQLCNEG